MILYKIETPRNKQKVLNISYFTLRKRLQLLTVTASSHLFRSGRFIDFNIVAHRPMHGPDKREFILVFQPVPFTFFFSIFSDIQPMAL